MRCKFVQDRCKFGARLGNGMKKALTIYVDNDADLTSICGTFVCEYGGTISVNMINCNVKTIDKKCIYFPKVGEAEWFDEVTE